MANKYN